MQPFTLKKDRYRKSRGGYARLLELRCRDCKAILAFYQKDGPGPLRRLYLDRIFVPAAFFKKNAKTLRCAACKEILGTGYIYKKEKRKVYRLYQDAVMKKVRRIN